MLNFSLFGEFRMQFEKNKIPWEGMPLFHRILETLFIYACTSEYHSKDSPYFSYLAEGSRTVYNARLHSGLFKKEVRLPNGRLRIEQNSSYFDSGRIAIESNTIFSRFHSFIFPEVYMDNINKVYPKLLNKSHAEIKYFLKSIDNDLFDLYEREKLYGIDDYYFFYNLAENEDMFKSFMDQVCFFSEAREFSVRDLDCNDPISWDDFSYEVCKITIDAFKADEYKYYYRELTLCLDLSSKNDRDKLPEIEKKIKSIVSDRVNLLKKRGYPYIQTYSEYLRYLETNFSHVLLLGEEFTYKDIYNLAFPFMGWLIRGQPSQDALRKRHTYIVGRGGSGKTVLLKNIFKALKKSPRIVIDPHGDLADDISCFGENTFRIAPHEKPFVINPFDIRDKSLENREVVAQLITDMIAQLVADVELSRLMETVIFPVVLTLLKLDYADFRMLSDCIDPDAGKERLKSLRGYVDSHILQNGTWDKLENKTYDTSKQSIFNRLQSLLNYSMVIKSLCGRDDFIEVEKVLSTGGEIVLSIPVPDIGEAVAVTLGRVFVTRMQIWAKERRKIPEGKRFPVYLIIDEFHNFISPVFAKTLDEYGRKFGLFLLLAHQHIKQLGDGEIRGSITTNTQNKIVGMSNHETRQVMQREMSANAEQFDGLRVGQFLAKFGEDVPMKMVCRNIGRFGKRGAYQYMPSQNSKEIINGWDRLSKGGHGSDGQLAVNSGGYTPKFDI
jgi:Cdc6-like AAA superfamily ATPase